MAAFAKQLVPAGRINSRKVNYRMKMKKWFIKNLGLKGSWKWAKKQMNNLKTEPMVKYSNQVHTTTDYFLFKPIEGNRNKNLMPGIVTGKQIGRASCRERV